MMLAPVLSQAQGLTLPELIRMALERNPQIAAAQQGVEVQEHGRDVAQRQRFPRLDIDASYLGAYPDQKGLIPRTRLRDRGTMAEQFAHNILTGSIALQVPIYTGGRLRAQVAIGELATRLAQSFLEQTRNDLMFNVSSTYYTILRVQEDLKATMASVQGLEEAQRNTEAQVRVGRAAQVELFKITTRLAAVRQGLIRIQNALDLAYAGLNTLLGFDDVTQRLEVAGTLEYTPQPVDLQASLGTAAQQRPELQSARRQLAIQEQQVRIAQAEHLPQVQFRARYLGAVDPDDVSPIPDDGTFEVILSQPLFTSGVISARIARERARLTQLEHELQQRRLEVALEVDRAALNLREAEKRRQEAEAARDQAHEVLRIEQLKLQVGKGRTEDLLIAQAAQLEAEANFFGALADANIARVEVQRAIGVFPARPENP
jgi:outer membrane protein TolC